MATCTHLDQITVARPQQVAGCEDCLAIGGTWLHLRVCRSCGHVACCDSSPNRHASAHARASERASDHHVGRAGGGVVLLLRRRRRVRARGWSL